MREQLGRHNQIAYINLEGQLCVIAPTGGISTVVDIAGRSLQFPAWSPDGTYLAIMSMMPSNAGVFALPVPASGLLDVEELRPLYINHLQRPFYLYWSPDSYTVSFIASHPQGLGLHLIGRAGRDHRLLTIGQPCFWDWTPKGEEVLVHSGGSSEAARLAFINARSADRDELMTRPGLFQAPGIAPSGRFWAFAGIAQDGKPQLVVAERTDMARITLPQVGAVALGWSPVHDVLAFMSPDEPARHFYGPLRVLDTATEVVRTLTDDTVLAFFWSPNGRYIAYLTLAEAVVSSPPPDSTQTNGGYTNGNGHKPILQSIPQLTRREELILNLWVVHVATGERRLLTAFQPAEDFVSPFLAFFDQYALSHRIWAPSSDALVLSALADERKQVIVVTLDNAHPRPIADGSMACWSHQ